MVIRTINWSTLAFSLKQRLWLLLAQARRLPVPVWPQLTARVSQSRLGWWSRFGEAIGDVFSLPWQLHSVSESYRRLSLRGKFTLHIGSVLVLLTLSLGPWVLYLHKNTVLKEVEQRGLQLTKVFAHASVQALLTDDFLVMRHIIDSVTSDPNVRYVMILDVNGQTLAHNDMSQAQHFFSDAISRQAAGAERPLVQELSQDEESLLDFAVPIYVLMERKAVARIGISIEPELAGIKYVANLVLALCALALVTGVVVAARQARSVTRPLAELVRGVAEVTAGELPHKVSVPVSVPGKDEVGQLGAAFNRMGESLNAVAEIDRAIVSSQDLTAVLQLIAEQSRQLLAADLILVALRDSDSGSIRLVASAGHHASDLLGLEVARGMSVGGQVLATRGPLLFSDCEHDPRIRRGRDRWLLQEKISTVLVAPALLKDQGVGLLYAARRQPQTFNEQDRNVLTRLARQMAIAIDNADLYQQVRKYTQHLEAQVAERTQALENANRRLEQASLHKSQFLASMSHELRTPLNAIIGFSEVLKERMFGELNDKQGEYVVDIHSSGQHLLALINDILDLSKIEAGRMELDLTTFDVTAALQGALVLVRERAHRSGLQLHVDIASHVGLVVGDERRFKQIVLNLLSNAVKFTPEGGRVELTATREGDTVTIAVSDTGIGIAAEDVAAVFEEFHQVGPDAGARTEGTGLGLALSKSLVEMQGGSIWLQSEPNQGSTFTFTLPVRP